MAQQLIPLDSGPNQTWRASVQINSGVSTFYVALHYSRVAGYWVMTIYDASQTIVADSIPMVTGLNLLRQFQFLGIGSLYLVNASGVAQDSPGSANLGTDFVLVWGDNVAG